MDYLSDQVTYLTYIIGEMKRKYETFDTKTIALLSGVAQSSISSAVSGRRRLSAEGLAAVARACERNPIEAIIVLGLVSREDALLYSEVTGQAKRVMDALDTLPDDQQSVATAVFEAMVKVAYAETPDGQAFIPPRLTP